MNEKGVCQLGSIFTYWEGVADAFKSVDGDTITTLMRGPWP